MPQLVKGGKYIFGWAVVNQDGKIKIPDEAYSEYNFKTGEKIVIMPGSKTSGGIIIAKPEKLIQSPLKQILNILKYSIHNNSFGIDENTLVFENDKAYCWTKIQVGKTFSVLPDNLKAFNILIGTNLLAGRGSHLGLSFIIKGPIVKEAIKHKNIIFYN